MVLILVWVLESKEHRTLNVEGPPRGKIILIIIIKMMMHMEIN